MHSNKSYLCVLLQERNSSEWFYSVCAITAQDREQPTGVASSVENERLCMI